MGPALIYKTTKHDKFCSRKMNYHDEKSSAPWNSNVGHYSARIFVSKKVSTRTPEYCSFFKGRFVILVWGYFQFFFLFSRVSKKTKLKKSRRET